MKCINCMMNESNKYTNRENGEKCIQANARETCFEYLNVPSMYFH